MKLGTDEVRPAIRRTRQRLFWLGLPYADATPLLAARLAVRRRSRRQAFVLVVAAVSMPGIVRSQVPDPRGTWPVVVDALAATLLLLAAVWAMVGPLRTERRLAAGLTARSAHPVALRACDVVGRWHLASAAFAYGAALAMSAVIWLAGPRELRVVAVLSAVTVAGCAAVLAAGMLHVLRRPAVAEDATSLVVDDQLRTIDARFATQPFPVLVVLPTVLAMDSSWARWALGGYIVAAALVALYAERVEPMPGTSVPNEALVMAP